MLSTEQARLDVPETSNLFGTDLPISTVALNILRLMIAVAAPVLISISAWILLLFLLSFILVPYHGGQARPSVRNRFAFCRIPTIILTTLQFGIASALPCLTTHYDIQLEGTQSQREIVVLNHLAFSSWLITIAIVVTVGLVLAVIAVVGDRVREMDSKRTHPTRVRGRRE